MYTISGSNDTRPVYPYGAGRDISLEDLVSAKTLNGIRDSFMEITGMRCVIANRCGETLTDDKSYTKLCKLVHSVPEGRQRCMACDHAKTLESAQKEEILVYTCHMGLVDAAFPIMVNGQLVGSILSGGVTFREDPFDKDAVKERARALGIDVEEAALEEALSEIVAVDRQRLTPALELLKVMTKYIAEMGVVNLSQKLLMNEIKSKAEVENLLRETEYKALQAQINPHFLFNCLDTISLTVLTEGAEETQELIFALSDLLRNLLKHTEEVITLREEMKYVEDYLFLQKARFADRIQVVTQVDDQVWNARIPKFILQPLVENAVVHGLEPSLTGGTLTLTAGKDEKNDLVITVADTSVGMDKTAMDALFQPKPRRYNGRHSGLGVNNVNGRIQHYFGPRYGVSIASKPGEGCRVTVTVPFAEE